MIEHIARTPRLRDRALFVGDLDDVVPDRFGPELPLIKDWTREHYDFPGYVTGFDPAASPTGRRSATSSATRRASGSASSRWAVPGSAGTCSAG
jgi:hypothetical protein